MRADPVQRTDLKRYLPHVVLTTIVLCIAPIAAAYRLSSAPFDLGLVASAVLSTLTSLGLAKLGAALWQRRPGSRDVVFEDLLVWGFALRVRNQQRVIKNAKALAGGLSHQEELAALQQLAKALETGDPYTHGHSDRVARHAYMVARAMKLSKRTREKVRLAAALHDVGKLSTPRQILTKPGRLTDAEYEIVKRHPGDGADMVAALNDPELTSMVRHHHERMDGTGYPDRLQGTSIPIGARIIAVADTFDAITSRRSYRKPRSHKDAIDILQKEAGTQLDGDVVKAFLAYYTGRKSIRLWLSISSSLPRVVDVLTTTARRVATNAAVVGGAAAVVGGVAVGGGVGREGVDDRLRHNNAIVVESSGENNLSSSGAPATTGVLSRDPAERRSSAAEQDDESTIGTITPRDVDGTSGNGAALDGPTKNDDSSAGSGAGGVTSPEVGSTEETSSTDSGSTVPDSSTGTGGGTSSPDNGGISGGSSPDAGTSSPPDDGGGGSDGGATITTPIAEVGTGDVVGDITDTVGGLLD